MFDWSLIMSFKLFQSFKHNLAWLLTTVLCFEQEIWRRPEPGSPRPPDLCRRSSARDAARWGLCSCSTNRHIWEHNVFLFVAHRHGTMRNPVKTCAVKRSLINWLPCYVCCFACGDAASPSGIQCLHHKSIFSGLLMIVVLLLMGTRVL